MYKLSKTRQKIQESTMKENRKYQKTYKNWDCTVKIHEKYLEHVEKVPRKYEKTNRKKKRCNPNHTYVSYSVVPLLYQCKTPGTYVTFL